MKQDNIAEFVGLSAEEEALFAAICRSQKPPVEVSRREGFDAHAAGKAFGEGPRPFNTVAALSWRIGWNQRAMEVCG